MVAVIHQGLDCSRGSRSPGGVIEGSTTAGGDARGRRAAYEDGRQIHAPRVVANPGPGDGWIDGNHVGAHRGGLPREGDPAGY